MVMEMKRNTSPTAFEEDVNEPSIAGIARTSLIPRKIKTKEQILTRFAHYPMQINTPYELTFPCNVGIQRRAKDVYSAIGSHDCRAPFTEIPRYPLHLR